MTNYAIKPPPIVALPILGRNEIFPVRRVYCIGRNYAAHAIEMGHNPDREPPFFFQKNPNNLDPSGKFPYPSKSNDVHHEVEMAVMLKSGGINIKVSEALTHIFGYAISLDMTRRDLQGAQKKLGRPWEVGKAFERSAPVGPIHLVSKTGYLTKGLISLRVNDVLKQEGDLNQMIWKIPDIISYLSDHFELNGGDVILSGTPSGVGSINKGDTLVATIDGLGSLKVIVS
ncbi:MAG: fumarylacetoacetate hydrolase family protein [Paracoccaceae bacterium]|nr:fumarylacetoacetate hydrolase family protein [Paracoccaceae bacterium]